MCYLNIPFARPVKNGDEYCNDTVNGDDYCNETHIRFKWRSNKSQVCKNLLDNPTSLSGLNTLITHLQNICTTAGLLLLYNRHSERAIKHKKWFYSE